MGKNLHFAYRGAENCAKVIRSVPETWGWFSGRINAPLDLVVSGRVAVNTGYFLSGDIREIPQVIGDDMGGGPINIPDYYGLREGKLPSFITFQEAGFGCIDGLAAFRDIAATYVALGYTGELRFEKPNQLGDKNSTPAWCEFRINRSDGRLSEIVVGWNTKYDGHLHCLRTILTTCYNLNLERIGTSPTAYT